MKKSLVFFLTWFFCASAQGIYNYADFDAYNYQLSQVGYPSKIIPLYEHQFAYVEWWEKGMGRPFPGYYLTAMDRNYEEKWFKPIADLKEANPRYLDLVRLQNSFAVIMDYPRDKTKPGLYLSFFKLNGDLLGESLIFSFPSKKKLTSQWRTDEEQNHLYWWGYTKEGKKLRLFATVYNEHHMKWQRELPSFSSDFSYSVPDANVTPSHDFLCLFLPEYSFERNHEDTVFKPILLLYNSKTKETIYDTIFSVPRLLFPRIVVLNPTTALLIGIAENPISNPFIVNRNLEKWTGIFYRKYDLSKRLKVIKDTLFSFPALIKDSLPKQELWFKEPDWLQDPYHQEDPTLYFTLEEAFQKIKAEGKVYFRRNLLLLALNTEQDTLKWANVIRKNQRYLANDHLLSFTPAFSSLFFHLIYLTEPGAKGLIKMASINKDTGKYVDKILASNQNSDLYFFPKRSSQITERAVILMGLGEPNKNAYRLIQVILPP